MPYKDITPPAGAKISIQNGKLNVPENPILPFIRGDGTGPDIWAASQRVFDAAVRQMLDLYVCLRPVQYFTGVPSPVKHPEKVKMVIFRENTEDIYAGIDYQAGSPEARKVLEFIARELPAALKKIRFGKEAGDEIGIGIKPVSRPGTERLARAAMQYALEQKRKSVTFVHKGNIMKYTEGAFRDWGYELAKREF